MVANVKVRERAALRKSSEANEPDLKANFQNFQRAARPFDRCVRPTLNNGFVVCGEERTASFAIDAVPIVTASYGPFAQSRLTAWLAFIF